MAIHSGFKLIFVGAALCSVQANATQATQPSDLGSKTPYIVPNPDLKYPQPPAGYELVYSELVARHGARTLSKPVSDVLMYEIWKTAEKSKGLTTAGEALGPQLKALIEANQKIGYGELTQLGKEEEQQLGERFSLRDAALLAQASEQGRTISVFHSGKPRAEESASQFVAGLIQSQPALQPLVLAAKADPSQLYFPKAPENEPYRDYLKHNHQLKNTLHEIVDQPESHKAAMNVLKPLFTAKFIHGLESHAYHFKVDGKTVEPDELDTARLMYELYSIAPGMQKEGLWQFSQWMPKASAEWFAYLDDAEAFYEKGPGFKGKDITFNMAKPLLNDFFVGVSQVMQSEKPEAARLRFTHAEVIAPLAALMQIEGSEKQAVPTPLFLYNYKHYAWRSEKVIPYAANMQWDVFRDHQQHYLVRMLYNEKAIHFKAACKPIAAGSVFYDFETLKHCYKAEL